MKNKEIANNSKKVNKKDFIKYLMEKNEELFTKNNITIDNINDVYEAIIDGIFDTMSQGNTLALVGFGSFYLQKHKGHPVRFKPDDADIMDYLVFKFSASYVFNKRLRAVCDKEFLDKMGNNNVEEEKVLVKK